MDYKGKDNPSFIQSSLDLTETQSESNPNHHQHSQIQSLHSHQNGLTTIQRESPTSPNRFETVTLTEEDSPDDCDKTKSESVKLPYGQNSEDEDNNNNNNTNGKVKSNPIDLPIVPRPEMVNLSKPSRKGSNVNWGSVYTVPIFARNFRTSSFESVNTVSDVEMTGHRRRASGPENSIGPKRSSIVDGESGRKNSTVRSILFGDPMSRRFSQDLCKFFGPEGMGDDGSSEEDNETTKVIFFQVFIPFLIAGFGNVAAGLILDYVQTWEVFRSVGGLFVLVASFLGFKGNLEMTLAARLSTQANLGRMDLLSEQLKVAVGNIALIQCQAVIVAFLASAIAIASTSLQLMTFDLSKSLILISTSLVTASVTGLFLAVVMVSVVIISRKANVNPDNVSTLIAAFLGDLTAVCLIAGSAYAFHRYYSLELTCSVIAFFIFTQPICIWIAYTNEYTRTIIGQGWVSIIMAMIISSLGGFIFDYGVVHFKTIALFQPIINGVGANLVAVQASRISTYFHRRSCLGEFPTTEDGGKMKICTPPHRAFFGSDPNAKTARLLLLMVVPGHIIYIVALKLILPRLIWITGMFLLAFMVVALVQVALLLYIAHVSVPLLWKFEYDPDNNAIPCLMSLGDLFGTALFTGAYIILRIIGDPNGSLN
ncbi:solute carrier family 41 member 1 [Tetranychus urticae]|uniref:SLC41A/MgtE integral membrane domain-containing protein n=1 Tax=Tetranychus urticae TaxID=32264 RepID=T1K3D2_TETUR|nr:solute carrier family 41 member 1 [Tetranychus urticae]